ncbi:MAG: M24 family metallopeptidase, partial [Planctomycetota bacterium]|nr:M24 family metallopeptidase [Planctomycetota bacterium]
MIRSTLHSDTGFDRHATDGHGAPIALRSEGDVEGIAAAGRVVADALSAARAACRPGVDTAAIAAVVEEVISAAGAESTILHAVGNPLVDAEVAPFPAVACVSVEDVAIHGVPGARILANGEIASIDVAVRLDGWCADAAITVVVGVADQRPPRLAKAAADQRETPIDRLRPGVRWSAVAPGMQ